MIEYVIGDATNPIGEGSKFIIHVVNDIGSWGAGFVLAVSKRWEAPELAYREWYRSSSKFRLGEIQQVQVEPDVWVINMLAQHGLGRRGSQIPLRYVELKDCMTKVALLAVEAGASIHMPRIGCGLACGSWYIVEQIIQETLISRAIQTTVYDLAR